MINLFPPNPRNAPRRKFRGKKRYFRGVQRAAEDFEFEPRSLSWWDYWHYHADWPGWGNIRWRYRREHIRALCRVYLKIVAAKNESPGDFQCWLYFSCDDAGVDAVFVHSANENGSPFPFVPENTVWEDGRQMEYVRRELGGLELRVGRSTIFNEWRDPPGTTTSYFVYIPGLGLPLESPGAKPTS